MVRPVVLVAALLVLAPGPVVAAAGEPDPQGPAMRHRTLAIASGTAIGGEPERAATSIGSKAAMRKFARREDVEELKGELVAAYLEARSKESVWAAVLSVGCDVPPDVEVTGTPEQVLLDPVPVEEPLPECFAPVTSVGVVAVRPRR